MSCGYGPARLLADLVALGHQAELVTSPKGGNFVVLLDYEIQLGKFAGRKIDLGLKATADFPRTVASAIHVRAEPQLFKKTDTVPQVRNILDSELGADWRYWSHNFGWSSEKTARRLMSQTNKIFKDA